MILKQLTSKRIFVCLFILNSFIAYSEDDLNILLGYPDSLGYIIKRPQYVISYSQDLNSARWVSWYVNKDCYGMIKRYSGSFITDTTLPETYTIIKHSDYNKSGYDKGHLVRSEERTQSEEDNKATFYLTNIIPQYPDLNRKIWLHLEDYCKKLCKEENKQLFIVSGGKYKKRYKKINNKIAIPDSCWKVVLILDSGKTINNIDTNTQIIAVMMPNKAVKIKSTQKPIIWSKFLTTTKKIENSTGFNFFPNIKPEIQEVIENKKYKNNNLILQKLPIIEIGN